VMMKQEFKPEPKVEKVDMKSCTPQDDDEEDSLDLPKQKQATKPHARKMPLSLPSSSKKKVESLNEKVVMYVFSKVQSSAEASDALEQGWVGLGKVVATSVTSRSDGSRIETVDILPMYPDTHLNGLNEFPDAEFTLASESFTTRGLEMDCIKLRGLVLEGKLLNAESADEIRKLFEKEEYNSLLPEQPISHDI